VFFAVGCVSCSRPPSTSCSSCWSEACVSQQGLGGGVTAPEHLEHLCRGLAATQGQHSVPAQHSTAVVGKGTALVGVGCALENCQELVVRCGCSTLAIARLRPPAYCNHRRHNSADCRLVQCDHSCVLDMSLLLMAFASRSAHEWQQVS